MRIIAIIFLFFITLNLFSAENNFELITMLQGNIGSYSQLTTIPASLKFEKNFLLLNDIFFNLGLRIVSGKTKLSGYSEYVPVNDIGFMDENGEFKLSSANFIWKLNEKSEIVIGVVDITRYGRLNEGLARSYGIGDERTGFVSTHFLRANALHSLEQRDYSSIPVLGFNFYSSENFNLKSYVTFGMPTEHIFFRNTWGVELNLKTSFKGRYTFHLGFADTEFSYTHHISPAFLLGVEQMLTENFGIFIRYNQAENHLVSKFFTDVQRHYNFGIFYISEPNDFEKSRHYFGAGLSNVKTFYSDITETALELVYRFNINKIMTLSPDIQFIESPNGYRDKLILIWGLRFFCSF